MVQIIFSGLMIPFAGTALGAALVLFMKKELGGSTTKILSGFAAGVMVAASIWSLLIPSIEQSAGMGRLSFIPAVVGFGVGMLFLLFLDTVTPHMHPDQSVEGPPSRFSKQTMMVLAITLHNIPEGMSVGILYAGWMTGNKSISLAAAFSPCYRYSDTELPGGSYRFSASSWKRMVKEESIRIWCPVRCRRAGCRCHNNSTGIIHNSDNAVPLKLRSRSHDVCCGG